MLVVKIGAYFEQIFPEMLRLNNKVLEIGNFIFIKKSHWGLSTTIFVTREQCMSWKSLEYREYFKLKTCG